jgi:hypothetical protein
MLLIWNDLIQVVGRWRRRFLLLLLVLFLSLLLCWRLSVGGLEVCGFKLFGDQDLVQRCLRGDKAAIFLHKREHLIWPHPDTAVRQSLKNSQEEFLIGTYAILPKGGRKNQLRRGGGVGVLLMKTKHNNTRGRNQIPWGAHTSWPSKLFSGVELFCVVSNTPNPGNVGVQSPIGGFIEPIVTIQPNRPRWPRFLPTIMSLRTISTST